MLDYQLEWLVISLEKSCPLGETLGYQTTRGGTDGTPPQRTKSGRSWGLPCARRSYLPVKIPDFALVKLWEVYEAGKPTAEYGDEFQVTEEPI